MTTRSAAVSLFAVGILGLATLTSQSRGQDLDKKPEATKRSTQDKYDVDRLAENEPDFLIWKQSWPSWSA